MRVITEEIRLDSVDYEPIRHVQQIPTVSNHGRENSHLKWLLVLLLVLLYNIVQQLHYLNGLPNAFIQISKLYWSWFCLKSKKRFWLHFFYHFLCMCVAGFGWTDVPSSVPADPGCCVHRSGSGHLLCSRSAFFHPGNPLHHDRSSGHICRYEPERSSVCKLVWHPVRNLLGQEPTPFFKFVSVKEKKLSVIDHAFEHMFDEHECDALLFSL